MRCSSCGFENPEGMKFCGQCATQLRLDPLPPESADEFLHALLGRVLPWMGWAHRLMGDYDGAIATGQQALALAAELGDMTLQVEVSFALGQACYGVGGFCRAAELLRWNVKAADRESSTTRHACRRLILNWENTRICHTYYKPKPAHDNVPNCQAYLEWYRQVVIEVLEIAEETTGWRGPGDTCMAGLG